jgi:hypothetical protein
MVLDEFEKKNIFMFDKNKEQRLKHKDCVNHEFIKS